MESALLDQGVTLMLVGMGTVFAFLSVLVIAMSAMSAIASRLVPIATEAGASGEEIAAITAAITQHKKNTAK